MIRCLSVFLLTLLSSASGQLTAPKAQFRVAFGFLTTPSDLGWTWRHNQGRIFMHTQLMEKYPDLNLQTIYQENVPEVDPPNCPPVWKAWADSGMDLIVGTSFGHQFCMADLVGRYPATVFFHISGYLQPPVPNWGLGYARIYQPTYLAGIVAARATQTGHIGAVYPIKLPETQRQLAAFSLGIARVNASVKVHVGWTGDWLSPRHEVLITQRLADLNCDVVMQRTDDIEGVFEANQLNVFTIGFNADHRMLAGENVLISPYFNWGVIYLNVSELVLWGNFSAATPMNLFPGLAEGAVALADPSFYVKLTTMDEVGLVQQTIQSGGWDPFCGPIRTNDGQTIQPDGGCLDVGNLTTMMWQPFNVIDHGYYALPGDACRPGEVSVWHSANESYTCPPCPGGTYSFLNSTALALEVSCNSCPDSLHAPPNSTACVGCPVGTLPSPQRDTCLPCPPGTYSAAGIACTQCAVGLQSGPGAAQCDPPPLNPAPIIASVAVAAALLLAALVLSTLVVHRRRTKAHKVLQAAPRGEIAILFTDVQSSTLLWDKYPEAMSIALDLHNRIVRARLNKYHGYEIKTIGDSFMVAFLTCDDAVACAMGIQEDLVNCEWPEEMMEDPVCSTQCDCKGQVIWQGLRVRMGINAGSPDAIVNRHTWRVDYFGPSVNLAARVEGKACGGQTLITAQVYEVLSSIVLEHYVFTSIGLQQFRGVTYPVEVYSVLPEPFATRSFPEVKDNLCVKCQEPLHCLKCDPPHLSPKAGGRLPAPRRARRASLLSAVSTVLHRSVSQAPSPTPRHMALSP